MREVAARIQGRVADLGLNPPRASLKSRTRYRRTRHPSASTSVGSPGPALEAILKLLDYGFKEMKLHSVEARTSPENIPSASLLGTTGFLKEGHVKEVLCFRGEFYDSIIYSKLQ
jgi:hypothetical protein